MTEVPQDAQSAAPQAQEQTAASNEPVPAAPAVDQPTETQPQGNGAATEEVHGRIVDSAQRLVQSIENIFEDTNLRGEIVAAKNELKDLLERLKGDVQGTPTPTPTENTPS